MNPRARAIVTACGALVLASCLCAAFVHLPHFGTYLGPYGTTLNAVAPHERQIPNVITAINFDYRGLDTMGEEFILFAAVAGLTLVLRTDRAETTPEPLPAAPGRGNTARSDAIPAFALAGIALTIAFGTYMAVHPHLTPGGGFQGGAITAGFAALLFLGPGYAASRKLLPHGSIEPIEALGAVGYVAIGLVTLGISGAFLANTLPLGGSGKFFSTGTIPLINLCVSVEVVAGFTLMFCEFADETRVERIGRRKKRSP